MSPIDLKSLRLSEIEKWMTDRDYPAYRARQVYLWLYSRNARAFDEMTDLPLLLRKELDSAFHIAKLVLETEQVSSDGTIKMLFRLPSNNLVETVLIPEFARNGRTKRLTVCVSSQVGCAMGCTFCATGKMGFLENLSSGDIFEQVWRANTIGLERFDRGISNIVFMGMGEPLLNYDAVLDSVEKLNYPAGLNISSRRITVSTVGLARRIRRLADDGTRFKLAISLHSPIDEKRSRIMPVNRSEHTDLRALRDAVQYYARKTHQAVTYEYCVFRAFNDTVEDAAELVKIVSWAPSKVNLIMYNPVPNSDFERTSENRLNRFIQQLVSCDVTVTVRRSRGQDIDAACGQLAARPAVSPENGR